MSLSGEPYSYFNCISHERKDQIGKLDICTKLNRVFEKTVVPHQQSEPTLFCWVFTHKRINRAPRCPLSDLSDFGRNFHKMAEELPCGACGPQLSIDKNVGNHYKTKLERLKLFSNKVSRALSGQLGLLL